MLTRSYLWHTATSSWPIGFMPGCWLCLHHQPYPATITASDNLINTLHLSLLKNYSQATQSHPQHQHFQLNIWTMQLVVHRSTFALQPSIIANPLLSDNTSLLSECKSTSALLTIGIQTRQPNWPLQAKFAKSNSTPLYHQCFKQTAKLGLYRSTPHSSQSKYLNCDLKAICNVIVVVVVISFTPHHLSKCPKR